MDYLFLLLGTLLITLSGIIKLTGIVWQIALAFQESPKWGWLSIAGVFCLCLIPNLIWMIRHGREGLAPALVILGGLPVGVIGYMILGLEKAIQAVGS